MNVKKETQVRNANPRQYRNFSGGEIGKNRLMSSFKRGPPFAGWQEPQNHDLPSQEFIRLLKALAWICEVKFKR